MPVEKEEGATPGNEGTPDRDGGAAGGDEPLADAGKKALDAERKRRIAAEKQAKDLADRLQALEDKDKDEVTRSTEAASAAQKRAEEAEARALRLEVAFAKGLSPAQAKRLVGSSQEELEADADDLLETFKAPEPAGGDKPPAEDRAKEALKPGSADPGSNSTDIDYDALVASM